MSPIVNASALHGLSTHALERLRTALREALARGHHLTEGDRCQFGAALQAVEAALRARMVPKPPLPRRGF